MALVSIRLPDDVDSALARESERLRRPKSEVARDAIVDYLRHRARERFLGEIAKAARDRGGEEALAIAAESLALDNEAFQIAERPGVHEPKPRYRSRGRKR